MPVYQAWCRPHGCPDKPTEMSFLIDRVDYRTAWQDAMALCFSGGSVTDCEGRQHRMAPREWTVQKLKLHEFVKKSACAGAQEPDEIAPNREMLDPEVRERELDRLYAGRRYDNVRFRRTAVPTSRLSA